MAPDRGAAEAPLDALVIGAGFSGLYMLHRLRQLGIRTRVLEMAENVGGTWLFNRWFRTSSRGSTRWRCTARFWGSTR